MLFFVFKMFGQWHTSRDSLSILSYNMQGQSSQKHRLHARAFLEGLNTKPEILCIQEHKLH